MRHSNHSRKMKKNLTILSSLLCFVSVFIISCGESEKEHPTDTGSEHPTETVEPTAKEADDAEPAAEEKESAAKTEEHPAEPAGKKEEAPAKAEEHPAEHPEEKSEPPAEQPAGSEEQPEKIEEPPAQKSEQIEQPKAEKKRVTKADIFAGISAHIENKAKEGNGKYRMDYKDNELALSLMKVHQDKLTRLQDGLFFACTDFRGDDGNTYDVDFNLKGRPGAMVVTEATVHKINGNRLYRWKQQEDGNWSRVPAEG